MKVAPTFFPLIRAAGRNLRFFTTQKRSKQTMKKLYQTLGVAENCEDEILRLAFVNLAKRFHPDSGTNEANAARFSEIENAYRKLQRHRFEEREKETSHSDIKEFDIKHTAPQHRQYLTYDVGVGTPSARQRRYTAERAQKAMVGVMEHRLKTLQTIERNTLVGMDKERAKDVKTRYGMDRLVEDLIQEAMNKGEFSELRGMGKPLNENACRQNPYVDFVTHKLNQVLIDNGFTPEWIQLSKEIREDTEELKKQLKLCRNKLGESPLSSSEECDWNKDLDGLLDTVRKINKKIDKYNLLVPILQKQMLQINLKALACAALSSPSDKKANRTNMSNDAKNSRTVASSNESIIEFVTSFFSK